MNTQNPTVSLHAYPFGAGMVKVDVQVHDVPTDLFGAAFHLVLDGVDVGEWSLYKYEIGNVFEAADGEVMTLVSQRNEPKNELVAGVSLKRDKVIEAKEGTLISFYIKVEDASKVSLSFENAVLSVLKEQRVNLENVVWQEAAIDLKAVAENSSSGKAQASVLAGIDSEQAGIDSADALWSVYGVLMAALILMLLFFVGFYFRKRRRKI